MRIRSRRLVSVTLAAALAFGTTAARAQEPSAADIAQARQLGQQAQQAYEAQNYAESEKLWTAASRLYPAAPTLQLGLARTQAKAGRLVAAQETYNKIIRDFGDKPATSPAFKDAITAAQNEVGPVSARLGHVTITVEGPKDPKVSLDGQPMSSAALGLKRPVDPGQHVVKATADGFKPAEQSFTVAEAGNAEAKLKMVADGSGAAVVAAPTQPAQQEPPKDQPPPSTHGGGSPNRTYALVAFGVGGAGLIVGAVTGFIAMGKHSDLEGKCPDGKCPADAQGDVDSYKSMGTISTVGFIVGGIGVAAGAVLWFTAPKEAAAKAANFATVKTKGVTMTPYVGGTEAGITGRF